MSIEKDDGKLENGVLNGGADSDGEGEEQVDELEEEEEDEAPHFCVVRPADMMRVVAIEKASYPPSEAASKSSLQYRQHHAAPYFRCAYLGIDDDDKEVIGFICATRCHEFEHEAMSTHHPEGPLLAIHSVVVAEEHRRKGVATAMLLDYIDKMREMDDGVQKLVLLAKKDLLSFYVDCGFSVIKPSDIVHGGDRWYDLELDLSSHKSIGKPYWIVDSFANVGVPGSGNPAAVVALENKNKEAIDPNDPALLSWMLMVAKEFNLSETAYVWEHEEHIREKELHWYIRYCTPKVEVNLCGHATLAAAGILYRLMTSKNANDIVLVLHAKEDVLTAQLAPSGLKVVQKRPTTKIAMTFPAKQPKEVTEADDVAAVQKILWEAIKVPSDVIIFMGVSDIGDVFVELTPEAFEGIGYDGIQYDAFLEWDGYSRGVVVCCAARPPEKVDADETASTGTAASHTTDSDEETLDFLSRFFGPKAGINEAPATGSIHCSLGPYFSKKLGKKKVIGNQTSERGGIVECLVDGDSSVTIIGVAVQTMAGTLFL
jgi:predicted PhzF superfamily epimerase YddE/YHI9/GNAT superfamily N-acetyltransferase